MDSPTFHPETQDVGTPEHGEQSEENRLNAVSEMRNRWKSMQSALIIAHVNNWLKSASERRRTELQKGRNEFDSQVDTIEKKSPGCGSTARVKFGVLIRKSDAMCDFAEKAEAQNLTERLNWLRDKFLEEAPLLQFAADSGQLITQEAIDLAESLLEECFARLSRCEVEKADSNTRDGVKRVCEIEKENGNDIIKEVWDLIRRAKANAEQLKKDGETRFIKKLSQAEVTGQRKATRKKTIENESQTEPILTRKRTGDVAIPSDEQTKVASRRRRTVHASELQQGDGGLQCTEYRDEEGQVDHEESETQQSEGSCTIQQQETSNWDPKRQEHGIVFQRAGLAFEQREQGATDERNEMLTQKERQAQVMTERSSESHRLLAAVRTNLDRLRDSRHDSNEDGRRAMYDSVCGPETPTSGSSSPLADTTDSVMDGEPLDSIERPEPPIEDTDTTMDGEPSAAQNRSERLQLPTKDTNVAMGGKPSADSDQLECLDKMSESNDRITAMMELLVRHTMRVQPRATGATTPPLSTPEHTSDETTLSEHPKNVGKFKKAPQPASQKDDNELKYRDAVRKHANKMMGRTRNDKAEPAPEEAVRKYRDTGKEEDGPSKERFKADFSEACVKKSPWNIRLADIFVDDYVKEGCPIGRVKDIPVYFFTYLQTLRTSHRNRTTTNSTGRGTVHDDVSKRQRIEQRKGTRFHHQLDALEHYKLDRFIKPLTEMSHAILSDDESDHEKGTNLGRRRYAIVNEAWRSDELIKWLRTMDLLALGERWDGRFVAQRGNCRRFRVHSTRSKDGLAVSGLPENCYDRNWLSSLKEYERKSLNVKPPLDMTFSEKERLMAAQYIPLSNPEARLKNPDANLDTSGLDGLDEWLLMSFGKVRESRSGSTIV